MATKPIPVRIPEEWLPRIDAVADKLGTNRSRLIAFSGQTFAEYVEHNGGASLPPDWAEILADMDGRRHRKGAAAKPAAKGAKKAKAPAKRPAAKKKR
jgi:hypothetical protein